MDKKYNIYTIYHYYIINLFESDFINGYTNLSNQVDFIIKLKTICLTVN